MDSQNPMCYAVVTAESETVSEKQACAHMPPFLKWLQHEASVHLLPKQGGSDKVSVACS